MLEEAAEKAKGEGMHNGKEVVDSATIDKVLDP